MQKFIDMGYKSINHFGEELCGDKVEIITTDNSKILILADGMGSGIRANIFATLTSKILGTMFKNELNIDEAVQTIARTLPISSVNGVAYCTFSILQIFDSGEAYLVEYDNPACIFIRNGQIQELPFRERSIEGKVVRESRFKTQLNDAFVLMSDGCIYCGTGDIMNYGWDWKQIAKFALKTYNQTFSAAHMAKIINKACDDLYMQNPSDDTTVAVARILEEHVINIMTGPPENEEDDAKIVTDFMAKKGIKIVSGGITAQIISKQLGKKIESVPGNLDPEIPPMSKIEGIDLVTEGIITLNHVIKILNLYCQDDVPMELFDELAKKNGASEIANIIIDKCNTVNLFVGKAVNNNYTHKNLPFEITARKNIIHGLEEVLLKMDKKVNLFFY